MNALETTVLAQMVPRKEDYIAKVLKEHAMNCLACCKHLLDPKHEECFAAAWWKREGKHWKDISDCDRRFPDYIKVMELIRPRWGNHVLHVVVVAAESSAQIWIYAGGCEQLVYHCYSDIE